MEKVRHPHSVLIDKIGAQIIRAQFSITHQRLYIWRQRGIPHTHRPAIAQLAMLAGIPIPADFLDPPERKRRGATSSPFPAQSGGTTEAAAA